MANTPKLIYRGNLTATLSTLLATVPAGKTWVITDIVLANSLSGSAAVTLYLATFPLVPATVLVPGGIFTWEGKQVLNSTETVKGGSAAAGVTCHISGVEIG